MSALKRLAAILVLGFTVALAFATTAGAAPSPTVPYSGSSSASPTAPPPSSSSSGGRIGTCSVSGTASAGSTLTINCSGFDPETAICVGLDGPGDDLGSGTTDSSGGLGLTVTLPENLTSGHHTIYVGPCGGVDAAAIGIDVGGSASGGGTAYTGVAVAGIGGLGAILLVGGAALLYIGRRRGSRAS